MTPAPGRTSERARRSAHKLLVGRVVRPHGVRGDLLVQSMSQVLDSIAPGARVYLGEQARPSEVVSLRRHGRAYLLHVEGCSDRESAEGYRGNEVRVRLEETAPLAPGQHYHWQIIGLRAVTEDGQLLGVIRQILETGANDVYVVEAEGRKDILLPAITSVVRTIDLEKGEMVVRLLPGLVEE